MKDLSIIRYPTKRPVFCRICASRLRDDESGLVYAGKVICEGCISEISVRQIIRICEFSSKEDLLYALGFKHA